MAVVRSMKSNKAPGLDGITSNILKSVAQYILSPLTHIVNMSIESGIFPEILKESIIIPVFKSGSREQMNNYRPISLTSSISKVLETIIHKRTYKFLEDCKILNERQFRFRCGKSTQDALANLTAKIYRSLDSSKPCLSIFIDLAKAFDTVNQGELLRILEDYGVGGRAMDWYRSYLTGRRQCVRIGSSFCSFSTVQCGVPQGTILGPLLFITYLNSIFSLNSRGELVAFADDTAIFYQADTWEELRSLAEDDFMIIKDFFDSRLLTLNYEKTCFMPFSVTSVGMPNFQTLSFRECGCSREINAVYKFKYLGVCLDAHLRWNNQVDHLVNKLRMLVPKFKNLREFCDLKLPRRLYIVLVQPHLLYGILG